MPGENEVIRLRAVFDGGSLRAGLDTGARDVAASTGKMGDSFKKLNADATTAIEPLDAQVAALRAQIAAMKEELGGAGRASTSAFTEARRNISAMGEEIGVRVPREVAKYIASLGNVAEIADKAFAVIGIIGMIALLPELGKKIGEVVDSLFGWDAATQALAQHQVEQNRELIASQVRVRESYRDVADVGLKGTEKIQAQQKNLAAQGKDVADQVRLVQRGIVGVNEELDKETHGWNALSVGLAGWFDGADEEIKKQKEGIIQNTDLIGKLADISRESRLEQARLSEALKQQEIDDARSIASARIEAEKSTADAIVTLEVDRAKRSYETSQTTLAQETAALTTAEDEKYTILQKSLERRMALARSNPDAAAGAVDVVKLNAEAAVAAEAHQNEMEAIATRGSEAQDKIDKSVAEAKIQVARETAEAQVTLAESTQQELFASNKITSDQLTQALVDGENKRTEAQRKALQDRLAVAQQDSQKNQGQIITLNGQLETLELQHQERLNKIKSEGDRRDIDTARQSMEEELRVAEETANRQLQIAEQLNNGRLKLGRESSREWLDTEKTAIDSWYQTQLQVMNKELAETKQVFGQESKEYKAMLDRMNQLDQQRQQKVQQALIQEESKAQTAYMSLLSNYNKALLQMMNGQTTFQKGFEKSWDEMVSSMASNILKGLEQWALSEVMHQTMAEKSILVSAKDSAAKAWASAPNPIIGAVEAAATFAAVMAYGSFDRGGIVPNDGFHQLHKKEMVLPAGLSTGLQSAIGKGTLGGYDASGSGKGPTGSSGTGQETHYHSHVNYQPTVNAYDRSGVKSMLYAHQDDLHDIVRQGLKEGKFS